jgi:hypothetical protein
MSSPSSVTRLSSFPSPSHLPLLASHIFTSSPHTLPLEHPHNDIQDPQNTNKAYALQDRTVPDESETGIDKTVKPGNNLPTSLCQAAREVEKAGKGLAESIGMTAEAFTNRVKDYVAVTGRRLTGMQSSSSSSSRKPMADDDVNTTAAGQMQYTPPKGSTTTGVASVNRSHARAKYDEMSTEAKKIYHKGEVSVGERFPNMAEAAKEQSETVKEQHKTNEEIARGLKKG